MTKKYLLHEEYIKQKGLYKPKFYNVHFTPSEISFIMKWFYWIEGLIRGIIPPLNDNQKKFINIFNTKIKPHIDPLDKTNKYYVSLTKEQKIYVKYYYVLKHKEGIKKYLLYNNENSLFEFRKPKHTFVFETKKPRIKNQSKVIKKNTKLDLRSSDSLTCKNCGEKYPKDRFNLGFKTCVNCSTVEPLKWVDKGFQTREGHKGMNKGKYRDD